MKKKMKPAVFKLLINEEKLNNIIAKLESGQKVSPNELKECLPEIRVIH